jgi:outer membrane protein TolC
MSLRKTCERGTKRPGAAAVAVCAALAAMAGCTASEYRNQADQVAADIVKAQQKQAIGRQEAFTIETPADTLRKRLMMSQSLPYSTRASLGVDEIPPLVHWPEKNYPVRPAAATVVAAAPQPQPASAPAATLHLSLLEALQVAAANNRDYQSDKENVYEAALALDLQAQTFRNTFAGTIDSALNEDLSAGGSPVGQWTNSTEYNWQRKLQNGTVFAGHLALDLVKLLSFDHGHSQGIEADATVTIPLLRGSGQEIVTEPMTLAQRDVVYSIATLEQFKQTLAVQVASGYLAILQLQDQVTNNEENYRNLILSTRRAERVAAAGRLSLVDVDRARQSELSARLGWISAQESYARQLDSYKSTLGLPTDCLLELDRAELTHLEEQAKDVLGKGTVPVEGNEADSAPAGRSGPTRATGPALALVRGAASAPAIDMTGLDANAPVVLVPPSRQGAGPLEMDPNEAVLLALANRLDLRNANGAVYDAQRAVVVAADALRAGLTLTAGGQAGGRRGLGSADSPGAGLHADRGVYAGGLLLDLPLERTAERNAYRSSLITLAQSARSVQSLEDSVKFQVREDLRSLTLQRESYRIQALAVTLAQERVDSTQELLRAGRAQMIDVLDAQSSLLDAKNALSAAVVSYRVAELTLQRDMGLLQMDEKGNWSEYQPPIHP